MNRIQNNRESMAAWGVTPGYWWAQKQYVDGTLDQAEIVHVDANGIVLLMGRSKKMDAWAFKFIRKIE